jgi:hypothetical protein
VWIGSFVSQLQVDTKQPREILAQLPAELGSDHPALGGHLGRISD